MRHPFINIQYELQFLLSELKFHDFANIFNCISNAEIILKELELIVLKAAHIKGILNDVLQVKSRIEYHSDKFFRMSAG